MKLMKLIVSVFFAVMVFSMSPLSATAKTATLVSMAPNCTAESVGETTAGVFFNKSRDPIDITSVKISTSQNQAGSTTPGEQISSLVEWFVISGETAQDTLGYGLVTNYGLQSTSVETVNLSRSPFQLASGGELDALILCDSDLDNGIKVNIVITMTYQTVK